MTGEADVAASRILHVDDDEDIRFLVELALDPASNLDLDSYASGDAALAGAREHPPDLALVDVMMPGMDGVTLAAAFREDPRLRDVPIVFVTAKAYPEEVANLRRAGAVEVLVKPFDLSVLEDLIRSLLAGPGPA
jgi:two-component system, OmpR family, response regulator